MKIPFTKMHGCGNDYIYINCLEEEIENPELLSRSFSDRHFGIGGDGIVLICPSEVADVKMRMFNMDGSEGKMCGNAIRCVAKYVYDNDIVQTETLKVETLSGIKVIELHIVDGKMQSATVDMGQAILEPGKIPLALQVEQAEDFVFPLTIDSETYAVTPVSMGNPHGVVFLDDIHSLDLATIGPKFEHHPMFPEGVNTEFIQIESKTSIIMRVWERGSGETLACGTGACAAVAASVLNGHCDKNSDVTVKLIGGELIIRYTDETVYMTGPATTVFTGLIEPR